MKTRVSSAFVNQQIAKMSKQMKSNLHAYKVSVHLVDKNNKTIEQSDHFFADQKFAHSFATKKADKNHKCIIFENAGGETYVQLAEYAIDPAKLARPSAFKERMNMAQAISDCASGNTWQERWNGAIQKSSVSVLVRYRRQVTA